MNDFVNKKSVRKCPYARKPVKVRKICTTYGKSVRVGMYDGKPIFYILDI